MKKRILVIIAFCLCFLGISSVSAKTYTIDDYMLVLQNTFSEMYEGVNDFSYTLTYNRDTGKITFHTDTATDLTGNTYSYTYEVSYDDRTDEIRYVRPEIVSDIEDLSNAICTSFFWSSLFEMHGYSDDQIRIILNDSNLSEEELKNKYGIEVEKEINETGTVPKMYKFTLNDMDDAPEKEVTTTITTKKDESTTTKSTSIQNPKTKDINISSLIFIVGLFIGIIIISFRRLKVINKTI